MKKIKCRIFPLILLQDPSDLRINSCLQYQGPGLKKGGSCFYVFFKSSYDQLSQCLNLKSFYKQNCPDQHSVEKRCSFTFCFVSECFKLCVSVLLSSLSLLHFIIFECISYGIVFCDAHCNISGAH